MDSAISSEEKLALENAAVNRDLELDDVLREHALCPATDPGLYGFFPYHRTVATYSSSCVEPLLERLGSESAAVRQVWVDSSKYYAIESNMKKTLMELMYSR